MKWVNVQKCDLAIVKQGFTNQRGYKFKRDDTFTVVIQQSDLIVIKMNGGNESLVQVPNKEFGYFDFVITIQLKMFFHLFDRLYIILSLF